jgi:predicted membrane-bound spermidine synthase
MPNQAPSHISDDFYPVYNYSENTNEKLKNKFIADSYNGNLIQAAKGLDTIQNAYILYAGEIAALEELKSLASDEISNKSANPLVLADLLEQAIAIAEEINETNLNVVLSEAIYESKAVLEAIYDGTIDDFNMPDSNTNTPAFSEEFDALKTAIINSQNQKRITGNNRYTN